MNDLADYLVRTRWFGGKGRAFTVTGTERLARFGADPVLDVLAVRVVYTDRENRTDTATDDQYEVYQVPLAYYPDRQERLDHAFVGWWEDPELGWVHAYDALHDRAANAHWLRGFVTGATEPPGALEFHRLPGHDLDAGAVGTLFTGEQSNSSVFFGEDSAFKLFRRISAGPNPDVEVHDALTRAGSEHIAHLFGRVSITRDGERFDLGMLQQFLRTATDGWEAALASLRALFAEPDVEVARAGGDFAAEAARLGEAVRTVHAQLATALPGTGSVSATACAEGMRRRLAEAVDVVPDLEEHAPRLEALFDAVAALPGLEVQRVHGDLHLGQTLRTSLGWKLVDFEGEPARPTAERVRPDPVWRDVAGMLRSFDYAARVAARQAGDSPDDQVLGRAAEWSERCRRHFLQAYASGPLSEEPQVLVSAFEADKAVYEVVYEARNRPGWVDIPLAAIAALGGA